MRMNIKSEIVFIALFAVFTPMMADAAPVNVSMTSTIVTQVSSQESRNAYHRINWDGLNLSEYQKTKLLELEREWTKINQLIRPKIIRDQQQLKNIMRNPNAQEDQIRALQSDIMMRKKQLQIEATENFLSKRRLLTEEQRQKLHAMMPE